jgi:N-acetylglucosaminyldiphosphoundecaprenol N-acetyl-beta-D-mannosaminyltransferase
MTRLIDLGDEHCHARIREAAAGFACGGMRLSASFLEHAHANVLDVNVSAIDLPRAVELADQWIAAGRPGYICMTGVHGVMEAKRDPELRAILNGAVLNAPDGMPMTWVGRMQGFREMDRVFGPEFMAALCRHSVERGYRNFLYGGKPGVAELLRANLERRFTGLQVVGTYTPPFGTLTEAQEEGICGLIREARPHIVWVGLSTPKQERFMARSVDRLAAPLLVGVGAAFDFHAGLLSDSPHWVKRAGLQWAHRLLQDPRRLWRRYLRNNPAFLWQVARQLAGARRSD